MRSIAASGLKTMSSCSAPPTATVAAGPEARLIPRFAAARDQVVRDPTERGHGEERRRDGDARHPARVRRSQRRARRRMPRRARARGVRRRRSARRRRRRPRCARAPSRRPRSESGASAAGSASPASIASSSLQSAHCAACASTAPRCVSGSASSAYHGSQSRISCGQVGMSRSWFMSGRPRSRGVAAPGAGVLALARHASSRFLRAPESCSAISSYGSPRIRASSITVLCSSGSAAIACCTRRSSSRASIRSSASRSSATRCSVSTFVGITDARLWRLRSRCAPTHLKCAMPKIHVEGRDAPAKLRCAPPHLEEHVRHDLLGQVRVVKTSLCEPVEARVVPLEQRAHRAAVAVRGCDRGAPSC